MGYISAESILPEKIIKLIQQYVDGECIYVPRKNENQKSWGEKNGTRSIFEKRTEEIFYKYIEGASITDLTTMYYLSAKRIREIINKEKLKHL
ncbi:MAG TPA: hypothetical protein DCM59_07815 [Clostridium sp.]|nr:hypothetical protein [Clostridium sp.]